MRMKKFSKLAVLLVVAMMVTILGGCSKPAAPAPEPEKKDAPAATTTAPKPGAGKKVCITLPGMLGDKSYNDMMKIAADKAIADFGVEVKLLEAKSPADFEPNNIAAANGGYDLVIILSGQQKDAANKVIPQYPNQKFATIDFAVPNTKNVYSTLFAANEGQFLVGAAMAMFTKKTNIDGVNDKNIIGWISGTETPLINDFYGGFEQGAKYIDPDIQILKAFAGSFTDPLKGKELALSQYEQGADIIAQVASGTGIGILEAAANKKLFAVGVDLNQDNLQPGYILTSMLKNVDSAAYLFIESLVKDTYKGGEYLYMNLEKGGVGLTDFSVFKSKWGDKFPQDIVDKCNEIANDIKSGKIKVNEVPGVRPW